jgi:hypothetical protein
MDADTGSIFASLQYYARSSGLLLIPIAAWNLALVKRLPRAFHSDQLSRNTPLSLLLAENILRIGVFALPFFMPLDLGSPSSAFGLLVYGVGVLLYFVSWLALIFFPGSQWSRSCWGFAAPAYTPSLWLLGIALLGDHLFWGMFYRWWMYLALGVVFLIVHIAHILKVYSRNLSA